MVSYYLGKTESGIMVTTDDSSHNEDCKICPVYADWYPYSVCASINLGLFTHIGRGRGILPVRQLIRLVLR